MKFHGPDGAEIMTVTALERKGASLVVRGQVFGAMPLSAELRPEDARAIFQLLDWKIVWCLLTILFRRRVGKAARR